MSLQAKKTNAYFCTQCGALASKPPCKRNTAEKNPALATLGTWSCPTHGKHVKVRRESKAA